MTSEPLQKPALRVADLSMRFGGVEALKGVSFDVRPGTISAVIGPNGAGKTTVFNLLTGVYKPSGGTIKLGDKNLVGAPPHRIARMGITRTFQTVKVFGEMSVLENVMVGRHPRTRSGVIAALFKPPWEWREEKKIKEDALKELAFVGVENRALDRCDSLPLGHLRLVEIARALATEPSYLLLDEPAAGLNNRETETLTELLRKILVRGVTVVVVDHDMDLVMEASDFIVVLNYGEKIAEGAPREIQNNPEVIEAYLGEGEQGKRKTESNGGAEDVSGN